MAGASGTLGSNPGAAGSDFASRQRPHQTQTRVTASPGQVRPTLGGCTAVPDARSPGSSRRLNAEPRATPDPVGASRAAPVQDPAGWDVSFPAAEKDLKPKGEVTCSG